MKRQLLFVYFLFFITPSVHAIVPLESLLLGDLSNQYSEERGDPLDYIFQSGGPSVDDNIELINDKERLGVFRGFSEEAYNLVNYCKQRPKLEYADTADKTQAMRSVLASFQYIGLDFLMRVLPSYARYFNFTSTEYKNLGDNLIGNYCSKNISFISRKGLIKNFTIKFDKGEGFDLPSLRGSKLFPKGLARINSEDKARRQEFALTIELFKSFCSWGGEVDNFRLLVPLLRSPVLASFLIRKMNGESIEWQASSKRVYTVKKGRPINLLCENLICRLKDPQEFKEKFPRSIGTINLKNDLQRMYCHELKNAEYKSKDQLPKIDKIIKKITFDDQNHMIDQMIALLTGIPDFFIQGKKYNDLDELLRSPMDKSWNEWAQNQNDNFKRDLFYEESLKLEIVDRKYFFNAFRSDFKVQFDVNLGEFDRVNAIVGKVKGQFSIKVSKKFLLWARRQWQSINTLDKKQRERVIRPFRVVIEDQVKKAQKSFVNPLWKTGLENLIAIELLEQVSSYQGTFFNESSGLVKIPIEFNYAPFALKYLNYQWASKRNKRRSSRDL